MRLVRPTDPDLTARHLTKRKLGLFAAKSYLEKHEVTADSKGLDGHDIITYQHRIAPRHAEKICGLPITNARVTMEVSSAKMMLEAIRVGMGPSTSQKTPHNSPACGQSGKTAMMSGWSCMETLHALRGSGLLLMRLWNVFRRK